MSCTRQQKFKSYSYEEFVSIYSQLPAHVGLFYSRVRSLFPHLSHEQALRYTFEHAHNTGGLVGEVGLPAHESTLDFKLKGR